MLPMVMAHNSLKIGQLLPEERNIKIRLTHSTKKIHGLHSINLPLNLMELLQQRNCDAKLAYRIQGQDNKAYIRERGIELGRRKCSIADITLSPNIKSLKAGDSVKACIEMIISPQYASDYYGPNEKLKESLEKMRIVGDQLLREIAENSLDLHLIKGKLLRDRPILIGTKNNSAELSISNGLAFQALTFTGINKLKGLPELKTKILGRKLINQTIIKLIIMSKINVGNTPLACL